MRELKADDQIVRSAITFQVSGHQRLADPRQAGLVLLADNELIRIGPPIGPHGHGLAAVNKLRAAFTKSMPAPHNLVGYAAAGCAIPPFHWLNGKTIADFLAVDGDLLNSLGER